MKLYECRHVPGKGRCLFAAQDIKAGDVIFTEMPLLLYPQIGGEESFCAHCLGDLHQKSTLCILNTQLYQELSYESPFSPYLSSLRRLCHYRSPFLLTSLLHLSSQPTNQYRAPPAQTPSSAPHHANSNHL
jgi:hypothetical protein